MVGKNFDEGLIALGLKIFCDRPHCEKVFFPVGCHVNFVRCRGEIAEAKDKQRNDGESARALSPAVPCR